MVVASNFLSSFYHYEEAIEQFVLFAEFIQPQLIKEGSESELMKAISKVKLIKANVVYKGITENQPGAIKETPRGGGGNTTPSPVAKSSIQSTIDEIKDKYTDDGAIFDMMAHSILVYGLSKSAY